MRNLIAKNIHGILWAAWRRRYLIAVPTLLMPVVGLIISLSSAKIYDTYTTILIQEAAKQNPFLEDLTVATNLSARMGALNALLHSRHVLSAVASELGLLSQSTGAAARDRRIAELSKALRARLIGEDMVEIRYSADRPEGMADLLAVVSRRFIRRIVAPQQSSLRSSEAFLKAELEKRRADLLTAEKSLAEYKGTHADELPELHATNVVRLGQLRQLLAERRTDLEGARVAQAMLGHRLERTNPVVGKIEESIVETRNELAKLRARYTDRHGKVRAAKRELRHLREERARLLATAQSVDPADLDRLWNLMATSSASGNGTAQPLLVSQLEKLQEAGTRVGSLETEVESLESAVAALNARVRGYGENERRLTEVGRDLKVKRKMYEDLSERYQLARVTGSLGKFEENERVKIIDPPFTPAAPSNMPPLLFMIAGLLGGVCLGIGLAGIAELIDTTVRRRDVLERLMSAPVLARIPVLSNEGTGEGGFGLDFAALPARGG